MTDSEAAAPFGEAHRRRAETFMARMGNHVRVGLSGWSYREWRADFYAGIPQRRWLEHCVVHFSTIEINATFYHSPSTATVEGWRHRTPAGFRFSAKAHRAATHFRRLLTPARSIARQRQSLSALGTKLAAVLWQCPAALERDDRLLEDFAMALSEWPEVRHAIEFRHSSWFDADIAAVLSDHRIANCVSDAARWPLWPEATTDLVYVRLHGHERTYCSAYGDDGLRPWVERIVRWRAEGRTVLVYFDNDAEGAAPRDALRLMALLVDEPALG